MKQTTLSGATKMKRKPRKKSCTICKKKIRAGFMSNHIKVCKTFFQWYKVYLTEDGFKHYMCCFCGMKKSSKDKIISHLQARHFDMINDGKLKCKAEFLDKTTKMFIIEGMKNSATKDLSNIKQSNKDWTNQDRKTRVCPICFKMWANWSSKDFAKHKIMCQFSDIDDIEVESDNEEKDWESLIQELKGK